MPEARQTTSRRLVRARRRFRAELAQLVCALTGIALGLLLPRFSGGPTVDGSRLVEPLITIGIGVIGLVSIVYSLLFGVVQWSASTFTPRLNLFRGDPLVWRTFALGLGVFVFCSTAGLVSANKAQVSVAVPGVAILGALTAIALIRGLQTRAFLSLQLAYVLEAVTAQGRAVIDDLYPLRSPTEDDAPAACPSLPHLRRSVVWTGPSGVVQQMELLHLIEAAAQADAVVAFRVGVGHTVHEGSHLADIHGGDLPDDVVRRAVVRGPERSFDQDPLLAVRLLADICLRALSPAVSDPATAVDAIDATEGLLRALANRDLAVPDVTDETGSVRVRLVLPTWEDYLRIGVADLLPFAAPFAMVLLRLQRLLAHLVDTSPPSAHAVLDRLSAQVTARLAIPA